MNETAATATNGEALHTIIGVGARPPRPGALAVSLAFAWKRIYRPAADCAPGEACAAPAARRGARIGFWSVVALVIAMLVYPYLMPLFY